MPSTTVMAPGYARRNARPRGQRRTDDHRSLFRTGRDAEYWLHGCGTQAHRRTMASRPPAHAFLIGSRWRRQSEQFHAAGVHTPKLWPAVPLKKRRSGRPPVLTAMGLGGYRTARLRNGRGYGSNQASCSAIHRLRRCSSQLAPWTSGKPATTAAWDARAHACARPIGTACLGSPPGVAPASRRRLRVHAHFRRLRHFIRPDRRFACHATGHRRHRPGPGAPLGAA